jgi:hypothetical protein
MYHTEIIYMMRQLVPELVYKLLVAAHQPIHIALAMHTHIQRS